MSSADNAQESGRLFREINLIAVSSNKPDKATGECTIVIQHELGSDEKLDLAVEGRVAVISQTIFVKLGQDQHQPRLQLYRRRGFLNKFRRPSVAVADIQLTLPDVQEANSVHTFSAGHSFTVEVTLGEILTETQVAKRRYEEARKIIDAQAATMDRIDRVTSHLRMVMKMAASFSQIYPITYAAVGIANIAFEAVARLPSEYNAFRMGVSDCRKLTDFSEEAKDVFKSEIVRGHIRTMMELVIRILELISRSYSKGRLRKIFGDSGEANGLIAQLRSERVLLDPLLALELAKMVQDSEQKNTAERLRQLNKDEQVLLQPLLVNGSSYSGKALCTKGTRVQVLNDLEAWAQDPGSGRLYWVYGVAGCGKSTTLASISDLLKTKGILAGAFFCKQDDVQRRDPCKVIDTLAYHLAWSNTDFKHALLEEYGNPQSELKTSTDLETRHKLLLKIPLASVDEASAAASQRGTFVIDALDECDDSAAVVKCVLNVLEYAPWLSVIATSRDLPSIRDVFNNHKEIVTERNLYEDNARADLCTFLEERMREQEAKDNQLERRRLDCLKGSEDKLVEQADGLFIWLHTVVKIVSQTALESERRTIVRDVLERKLSGDSMTAMYRFVLDRASKKYKGSDSILRAVLGLLLVTSATAPLSIDAMYEFLRPSFGNWTVEEFSALVMELNPVLTLSRSESTTDASMRVQACHASFLEFIEREYFSLKTDDTHKSGESVDNAHAHPLWSDLVSIHRTMALRCFEIMENGSRVDDAGNKGFSGLRFNICGLESSLLANADVKDMDSRISRNISPELVYSCRFWVHHVLKSSIKGGAGLHDASRVVALMVTIRSLYWLEVLCLTGNLDNAYDALHEFKKSPTLDILTPVSSTIRSFLDAYGSFSHPGFLSGCALETSTPHLYLSLAWIRPTSILRKVWESAYHSVQFFKEPIFDSSQFLPSFDLPKKFDTFALSPDNHFIASGSRDGRVAVWDLQSGMPVRLYQIPCLSSSSSPEDCGDKYCPVDALCYTTDKTILCISSKTMFEMKTDVPEVQKVANLDVELDGICCMAFSQASRRIAVGLSDGTIALMDSTLYTIMHRIEAHSRFVNSVTFSTDGKRLASGGDDGKACVWDVDHGTSVIRLLEEQGVTAVAFSRDEKNLLVSSRKVRLWSVENGEPVVEPWRTFGDSLALTFCDDTRVVAVVANKWPVRAIDPDELVKLFSCEGTSNYVDEEEGKQRYVYPEQARVEEWDTDAIAHRRSLIGHTDAVNCVQISPNGNLIVSASDDSSARVWDSRTGEPIHMAEMCHLHLFGYRNRIFFVALSPDCKYIASGGDDCVRIWDAMTGEPAMQPLEGHSDTICCGCYSPDGSKLVSGSRDGMIIIWDAATGFQIKTIPAHESGVYTVAFAPNNACIVSLGMGENILRFWDGYTGEAHGEPFDTGETDGPFSVTFSHDSTHLALGSGEGRVLVMDVRTRSVTRTLEGHQSAVFSICFSTDGSRIYSGSSDKTIKCWDFKSGRPLGRPLLGHSKTVPSLSVSENGTHIVSGSWDNSIRIWDTQAFFWESDKTIVANGLRGPDQVLVLESVADDGWVRSTEGGLLLWVPHEFRSRVCDVSSICISADASNRICIEWEKLLTGECWKTFCEAMEC